MKKFTIILESKIPNKFAKQLIENGFTHEKSYPAIFKNTKNKKIIKFKLKDWSVEK